MQSFLEENLKSKVKRMGLMSEIWERVNQTSGRREQVAKNTIYLALDNPSTPFRQWVYKIAEDMVAERERLQEIKTYPGPVPGTFTIPGRVGLFQEPEMTF